MSQPRTGTAYHEQAKRITNRQSVYQTGTKKYDLVLYLEISKIRKFISQDTEKSSIPLYLLNWTIVMAYFMACPLMKLRNFKDYKIQLPDL